MKKLFMFLAVAGLATFGASCSSSDDNGGGKDPQLTLKADKTSIKVDETVKFTVEVAGKAETGAELYKDGTKIANPYKFTEEGEFNIVAKKKGALDSQAVKITVTKDGNGGKEKTLTLTADKTAVKVGEKVTFTVKDNEGTVITDATIKQGNVTVEGGSWTATATGTFKFKATKTGYTASGEVSVEVTEPTFEGRVILTLVEDPNNIIAGTPFTLLVKDQNGNALVGADFYVGDEDLEMESDAEGKLELNSSRAGEYAFKAIYRGVVSNVVTVNVKPLQTTLTGTVNFDGTAYPVTKSYLVFLDIYAEDEAQTTFVAGWQVETPMGGGKTSIVRFFTPAVRTEQGFSYERPTSTNTEFWLVGMLESGAAIGQATTGEFAIDVTPNQAGTIYTGTSTASATLTGNKAFSQSLDGEFEYFDASGQGASARATQSLAKNFKKSVYQTKSRVAGVKKANNVLAKRAK